MNKKMGDVDAWVKRILVVGGSKCFSSFRFAVGHLQTKKQVVVPLEILRLRRGFWT
jgi:hypothetical protein